MICQEFISDFFLVSGGCRLAAVYLLLIVSQEREASGQIDEP
jgi:hypothetical protein